MNRRGLVVGTIVLAHAMIVGHAAAQDSPRPRSLAERLAELRRSWGDRDEDQERQQPSAPAGRANTTASEPRQLAVSPRSPLAQANSPQSVAARPYPRVNTSELLPNDYSHLRRREEQKVPPLTTSQPNAQSQPTRTAALPERIDSSDAAEAATEPQSLGDAYLAAPQSPQAATSPQAGAGAVNPFKSAAGSTAAASKSSEETASRPSPTVRRSPKWTPPADFDPAELRRDLVDSSGRPLAGEAESRGLEASEDGEPRQTLLAPAPMASSVPADMADEGVEPQTSHWTSDEATPMTPAWEGPGAESPEQEPSLSGTGIQSYGAQPIAPEDQPSAGPSEERVQREGQRAFGVPMTERTPAPAMTGGSIPPAQPVGTPSPPRGASSFDSLGSRHKSAAQNVLITNSLPMISSHVSGPRQIMIGREAHYQLQLANQGETPAEQVVAEVHIPEAAEVVDTVASSGIIQQAYDASKPNTFRWQLSRLAAHGTETLDLKLIPRSSRPLELGVNCSYAPIGARAVVEVQEPKLRMTVTGPGEVLYGTPQLYRLTLSNPGSGVAEDVQIHLLPPGGGEETVSSHLVGSLAPGENKVVEVELTAREAGKLFVKASATAAGDISTDTAMEIFCRKPELEVDWRGPEQKYAGTAATYFIRVRNPGTAPASDVTVGVRLPEGAEFLSASEGQSFDPQQSTVVWRVGALRPGDDYYMELKCLVNKAGLNKLDIKAAAGDSDLVDVKTAETNVVALADLKLEVSDPKGPVPVGQEAVYEIRIRNRGTNTAEEVNVVALFSDGIDAESVEGAQYSIADGRVTFRTIEALPAGGEILLKIRARAKLPGTHIFRAEVLCRDLEIKLAAEETTRFYQDDTAQGASGSAADAASRSEAFQDENGSRY